MTDQQFMIWSGTAMLAFFALTLIARPLQKYTRIKYLMRYRRQLGWATGFVSAAHFLYWLVFYSSWSVALTSLQSLWFQSGLLAFFLIGILTLTSNTYSVKKLGKNWKKIHKLTYLIPFIVAYHVAFAIRGFNEDAILWAWLFIPLVGWRYKDVGVAAMLVLSLSTFLYYNVTGGNPVATISEPDIEFVCDKPEEYPHSISCGWPVYLDDGTRIDSPNHSPKYGDG